MCVYGYVLDSKKKEEFVNEVLYNCANVGNEWEKMRA